MTNDGIPTPARYAAIVSVSSGSLLLMVDASIAAVALPTISEALQVSASRTVLIITLYQLILAMTIIPFSALGDYLGQRRLYRIGLLGYIVSGLLCLVAESLPVLLVLRALQALGAAAAFSVTFGLIRSIYPSHQLGRGLGLNTLFSAGGNALGPALGGLILSIAAWQWVFVAGVPLAVISFFASGSLPNARVQMQRFDLVGALLCAATFALFVSGLEWLSHSIGSSKPIPLLLASAIVATLFVRHQRRQPHPVLPIDLLARPSFAFAILGSLMGAIASTTILFSLPFRLHEYGFGPAETGAMIASYAVASFMIAPAAGMLSDRISPNVLGAIGLIVAIVSMLLIGFLPEQVTHWDISWRVWLCGAGFAMFLAPNARIVISVAPVNRAAAAGGLVTTMRMLGIGLSATLIGALLSLGLGSGSVPSLIGVAFVGVSMICLFAQPRLGES